MRVDNSIKNMYMNLLSRIIVILLGFISRKVFIDSLDIEYLGVNGLLTNILGLLALVEAGIGSSIIYSLYKPLADNDKDKTIALVQLYKKSYQIISVIILGLSIIIYPFTLKLLKGNGSTGYITIVYFLFVIKSCISYLFSYKWSLIHADQKGYILTKKNLKFSIINNITKIIILKISKSYILYIAIELVIELVKCSYNSKIVADMYPYINTKQKYDIEDKTRNEIIKNIKALFLHNIAKYCVFGTDNILISIFTNVKTVGLFSNYSLIIGQVQSLAAIIFESIGSSVGNLIAVESDEKKYTIFKITYFINFWIYSVACIVLYDIMTPFISLWIGKKFLLDKITLILLLVNFYITGLRASIMVFKTGAGIFDEDKYMPLIESTINLVASIILGKTLGLIGVFLGTMISTILTVFWNAPRLVYKNVFNKPVRSYFIKYIYYLMIMLISGGIATTISSIFKSEVLLIDIINRGIVDVIITSIIYIVVFYKSKEMIYLKNILYSKVIKFKRISL